MSKAVIIFIFHFILLSANSGYSAEKDTIKIDSIAFKTFERINESKYFIESIFCLSKATHTYVLSSKCIVYRKNDTVDIKDGYYHSYYQDGSLFEVKKYKRGLIDGTAYAFHSNGNLIEILNYKNGQQDGLCQKFHYTSGKILEEAYYREGYLSGTYKSYYSNGNLLSIGEFNQSKKVNKWIYYYENGKIQSSGMHEGFITIKKNEGEIFFIDIQTNGKYDSCKYDSLLTLIKDYYETNYLSEELIYYCKIGKWKYYSEDGRLLKKENYKSNYEIPFVIF